MSQEMFCNRAAERSGAASNHRHAIFQYVHKCLLRDLSNPMLETCPSQVRKLKRRASSASILHKDGSPGLSQKRCRLLEKRIGATSRVTMMCVPFASTVIRLLLSR
jgi:hypothetical protein